MELFSFKSDNIKNIILLENTMIFDLGKIDGVGNNIQVIFDLNKLSEKTIKDLFMQKAMFEGAIIQDDL